MSVYEYGSCIKLTFDKALINDVVSILGTEEYKISVADRIISGTAGDSSYELREVFDGAGSGTDYHPVSTPADVIIDMLRPVTVTRVVLSTAGYWSATACTIYGSTDGTNWVNVKSVTYPLGANNVVLDAPTTYRYWEFSFSGNYGWMSDITFYGVRNIYDTTGWQVFGQEYIMVPEGELEPVEYTVRKVTKSEDNYSIFLWLDLPDRVKQVQDNLHIKFTGTLFSEDTSFVEPFDAYVSAAGMDEVFNPYFTENIQAAITIPVIQIHIYYVDAKLPDEYISAQLSGAVVMYHVNDINQ